MAFDICVCFRNVPLTIEQIARSPTIQDTATNAVYVILGLPRPESANQPFFTLWADQWIDLPNLCKALSRDGATVCVAWKVEHAGMGGYRIYKAGEVITGSG